MKKNSALLEQYKEENLRICQKNVKFSAGFAILASPSFLPLDYLLARENIANCILIRLIMVIGEIIIYILTRTRYGLKYSMWLGVGACLVASSTITGLIHITGGSSSPYYAGLLICLFSLCVWIPITFQLGLLSAVVIYATYVLPFVVTMNIPDWPMFINNNYFMIIISFLSVMSLKFYNDIRFNEFKSRFNVQETNQKLAEANKNKDIFLSNVSHELRTPLTLALTPLESMMQGELGQFKKEENQTLERMHENLHALLRQINDLLDLTRLQEGRMVLKYMDDDISQLIEGIVSRVKPTAEKKEITISYTHEGDAIVDLFFDHAKMEKVIINLVSNALKFTKRGGRIDVLSRTENGKVIIDVSDTGVGIENDKLDSVFERFVQADGSYSREYGGSGIGLALVKDIVELHGGEVSVQSQFGKGSTFTVQLPRGSTHIKAEDIVKGEEESKGELESLKYSKLIKSVDTMTDLHEDISAIEEKYNNISSATKKVLIVEDNPDMYSLLADVLHNDYKVYIAPNGEEGLNKVRELHPDIVTTDIMMPKKDGISMLKDIRADEKIKNTPVIILSSKAEVSSKIEGLEKGADDFIPKPFNPRELKARIRSLIMQRKIQTVITEKKSLEKQIASLSRLTASIAHEINNPVGNIRHSCSVLERIGKEYSKQHGSPVNEDKGIEEFFSSISDLIKLISIDSQRALEIVDDFKLLSKNTRMHKVKERFNLKERLNEDLFSIMNKIEKSNHQVILNCPDIEIESYPGVFSQIFSNLVSNAMIHGFDPGISGKINIDVLVTAPGLKLVFADNGRGILPDDQDKIFEPFYTTNKEQGSTGLGLNIVYNLITQKLGGEIICESKPNEGTKLIISMPVGSV